MPKKTIILVLLTAAFQLARGQQAVTTSSLLREMIDPVRVTRWPKPFYQTRQASSYDRQSVAPGQPGWFANADATQYIRTERTSGREEHVMLDAEGPGTIVRFWLTTFKRRGTLRVYFDHQKEPEITIPAYDLMQSNLDPGQALLAPHSSYEPKEKGGSNLYLPMPFSKHCKVTFEEGEGEKQPRYYQINYRRYAPGTRVKTFSLADMPALQPLLRLVNEQLLHPTVARKGLSTSLSRRVTSGAAAELALPGGSRAITQLKIKIDTDRPDEQAQALRSLVLRIRFDGEQTVWCPIGDFSGTGVGGRPLQSWYRTVDTTGRILSRWVMPYQRSAQISVLNTGSLPVQVQLSAATDAYQWDESSMYFHASWKAEGQVRVRKSEEEHPIEWNLNTISGKGVFMGESLAVYNQMHAWYGEGDQKLWVDQDTFPSEFGTGTEDYYNTSWAPVVLYQTPFANAPRADHQDSFGHNTFTRTRILDAVPFLEKFKFDLEMLGWQNGQVDMATVTYWYGFKGARTNISENLTAAAKPIQP